MTANVTQLDTSIEVVTPENIAFRYRVAGPFRRLLAYLIDLLIRVVIIVAVSLLTVFVLSWLGLAGFGLALVFILYFVLSWFYGGLLEAYWNGQTVGKRAVGIRVLSTDGRPINGLQAALRNVLREADALPPFVWAIPFLEHALVPLPTYLAGVVAMLVTRRFQRLGDLACGTMVVTEERSWLSGLVRIDEPEAIRLAAILPTGIELTRTLREALAGYVERRRYFPPGRRADIARHVGRPLCEKFGLPPDTNHDLLLCAVYHRAFVTDQEPQSVGDSPIAAGTEGENPFLPAPPRPAWYVPPTPQNAAGVDPAFSQIEVAPVSARYIRR